MSKKTKKEKAKLGKKEFVFNLISIIILGILAIYFGSRAVYFAVEEYKERENYDKSLAQAIINSNSIATEGNGLYQDENGYYFHGEITNNYVTFNNINYRILSINNDKELTLISDDVVSSFMWGNDFSYENSNIYNWLNKTDILNSGVFYDLVLEDKYLVNQTYEISKLNDNKLEETDDAGETLINILSADEYIKSGGKESFINNEKYFWILGTDSNENNLYVDTSGNIKADTTGGSYGVKAVITLNKDVVLLRGKGEVDNPYVIQTTEDTYINEYVKLGEDVYKVFEENDGILKLVQTNPIMQNDEFLTKPYGVVNSKFNLSENGNIASYLNNEYLNNLSYKESLVECSFEVGLINDDNSHAYSEIYSDIVTAKIGLLNIFDYNNTNLSDYYYLNYTGHVSDTAFTKTDLGYLKKTQIDESKNVVPVVCINKEIIADGVGSDYSPYTVE